MDGLKERWSTAGKSGKGVYKWFIRKKACKVFSCLGASVREQAGLRHPPARFTTNPSEGNNKVVQDFVHEVTRKTRISEFKSVQSLQKLIQRQQTNLEMAVINEGIYHVRVDFNRIIISPYDWVRITSKQHQKALQRVHEVSILE